MVKPASYIFAIAAVLSAGTAVALGAVSWLGPTYSMDVPHIHQTAQVVSNTLDLNIQHDSPCDVTVHPRRAGGEVLTAADSSTLQTSYKLTGDSLATPDADWVSSGDFVNKVYHIATPGPATDVLHLAVQGESPSGRALPAGDYTTDFVLTATW